MADLKAFAEQLGDDKWKHLKISRIIEVIINRTFICRDCEITFDSAEEMVKIATIKLLLNKI